MPDELDTFPFGQRMAPPARMSNRALENFSFFAWEDNTRDEYTDTGYYHVTEGAD